MRCLTITLLLALILTGCRAPSPPPTAEQRAAQKARAEALIKERVDAALATYVVGCHGAPYPSTLCPAWYPLMGDTLEDEDQIIHAGPEADRDEHPCFQGQIKANRRSMIYHLPRQQYYAVTRADVLCYDSAAKAMADGYRESLR